MSNHTETAGSPVTDRASVFISYRRSDGDVADRLYALIQARGVSAWYDPLIPKGTDWREAIVEHLGTARVMVVLLSAAAMESEELRNELAVADLKGVPMLAVRLEDVELRGAFAYELARNQWFDLFADPLARLAALADLLEEIARTPREAPLDSILREWERRWRELAAGRVRRWTRNNARLVTLFIFVSAVVFLLYYRTAKPMENLTEIAPLTAFFFLALVATVGSPLLFFSRLLDGVGVRDLPLLVASAANTAILVLLMRNFFSWAYHRLVRIRAPK